MWQAEGTEDGQDVACRARRGARWIEPGGCLDLDQALLQLQPPGLRTHFIGPQWPSLMLWWILSGAEHAPQSFESHHMWSRPPRRSQYGYVSRMYLSTCGVGAWGLVRGRLPEVLEHLWGWGLGLSTGTSPGST